MNQSEEKVEVKSYKTRIMVGLIVTFIIMSIAYIPLAYRAKFGVVDYAKDWDIESTIMDTKLIRGSASEKYKAYAVGNVIYFGVILKNPGDSIEYEVEVNNNGKLDARLEDIIVGTNDENNTKNAIKYTVTDMKQNDVLKAGESKTIHIKVEWDPAVNQTINSAASALFVNLQFVQD